MALSLGSGIDYQGTENNFARDRFTTLADMVGKPAKNLPKMFISLWFLMRVEKILRIPV